MTIASTASIVRLCPYCSQPEHGGKCPLVSAFEYHPNGTLKRVEFHGPAPLGHFVFGPSPFPKPDPIKGWEIT